MSLVPFPRGQCPDCGNATYEQTTHQPALLRGGGYGATTEEVRELCPECGYTRTARVTEVHPRLRYRREVIERGAEQGE